MIYASKENQDRFVLAVLDSKQGGTYLEIGSSEPVANNNTYTLETYYGWRGVGVEIEPHFVNQYRQQRTNPCVCEDATKIDYRRLLADYRLGPIVDYLQLDVDPAATTFKTLQLIPFDTTRFRVITYEHDYWQGGEQERLASRQLLMSLGYQLVIADVLHRDLSFEDWYIHPELVEESRWRCFAASNQPMDPASIDNTMNNRLIEMIKEIK